MFLPTASEELKNLKWDTLDIILVTGDTYVDSPFCGVAVIGKVLFCSGFRVGIIAQPDWHSPSDICRLGEPKLFWGITAGAMDSMIANYTATKKKRQQDDLTAGGRNNRRPDRACIVYANLVRQYYKNSKPLVLGGLEASLRRIAHYDYWSDSIRRSLLFDARADVLVYGMGEKTILELARKLQSNDDIKNIRGICFPDFQSRPDYLELPSYEDVLADRKAFARMFNDFYANNDPQTARGLVQKHGSRYLIHNPPQQALTTEELDKVYALTFEREMHPFYAASGHVRALQTTKFSLIAHRGCFGECNFCSIGIHEGRAVVSRSERSIIKEAQELAIRPDFNGYISDVGGATANMYGIECPRWQNNGACRNKRCLYPKICKNIKADHGRQINLLRQLRALKNVKKIFVSSGIRYDLLLADKKNCLNYMRNLVQHHLSGQLKVAPEHSSDNVLELLGKPKSDALLNFKNLFEKVKPASGSKQFLTYYFIAAHPGCTKDDMRALKKFTSHELKINPRQVQIFTPTPSTYSSMMYWTGIDPFTGRKIFIEKDMNKKQRQKDILVKNKERPGMLTDLKNNTGVKWRRKTGSKF